MKHSLLIIGADSKFEEEQLKRAARLKNVRATIVEAAKVKISLRGKEARIQYNGKDITNLFKKSVIVFRRTRGCEQTMISLALLGRVWGVPHTDSFESIATNLNKFLHMPAIRTRHLKHISTLFFSPRSTARLDCRSLSFPVIVKPALGRHGEGIHIIESAAELRRLLSRTKEELLIQRYIKGGREYRVFVVGKKVLGVVRKVPAPGKKIANYSAGATFLKDTIKRLLKKECVVICREQGIDIGGVDLIEKNGTFYLLEVNRCPEFRAFTKATGIDVAGKIVKYVIKR